MIADGFCWKCVRRRCPGDEEVFVSDNLFFLISYIAYFSS
jgi:hypothetical protein